MPRDHNVFDHATLRVSFGNRVPGPMWTNRAIWPSYPTILDFPAPALLGYTRETVIAEKLEALVQLRMLNSRMKDYFDIWILLRHPELDQTALREAIERTFKNRKIEIDATPIGLSPQFGTDPAKQTQSRAFLKRSALTDAPEQLAVVVDELRVFLKPIFMSLA